MADVTERTVLSPIGVVDHIAWPGAVAHVPATRTLAEELPVALTYQGSTHAVMMATPCDLEDFAVGFSLSEGCIDTLAQIDELSVVRFADGIELRMWVTAERHRLVAERRRLMAGPTGCGLCGVESISGALPLLPTLRDGPAMAGEEVTTAMAALTARQPLHRMTHATHAAGYWRIGHGFDAVREDVGRHNALDKLIGHMARAELERDNAAVVITSRVSIELVQKVVRAGISILIAASAPTGLAVRMAEESGLTLIGAARDQSFEVFSHPTRILRWDRPMHPLRTRSALHG